MLTVSQSKIKKWRSCRLSYHYKYVMKLRPRTKSRALTFGSVAHAIIEGNLTGVPEKKMIKDHIKSYGKLMAEEKDLILATVEEAQEIMREYDAHWKKEPIKPIKYEGSFAEHRIEYDLTNEIKFVGIMDVISRIYEGTWLVDHKTFTKEPSEDTLWKNIQSAMYNEIWVKLGNERFDGALWNFIRSAPIASPSLNKDGTVSKRMGRVLPLKTKKWLKENGLKAKDHPELMEAAEANLGSYFIRRKQPIPKRVSKSIFRDFMSTSREIADLGHKHKERSISMNCDWCEYAKLCNAEINGMDMDFLIEKEYINGNEEKKKASRSKRNKGHK